jgi:predicted nucleotidyltransferase
MAINANRNLSTIIDALSQVGGIEAIVLGGSRARGTHTPGSDFDLGLYYHSARPLNIKQLNQVAAELDDSHRRDLVTDPGGWGPWINGGGWLTIQGQAVDLIYRELDRVTHVIRNAVEGRFEMIYQPGHPHGFPSYIYMSEVALCQPLWDPHGTMWDLKPSTQPYPSRLKRKIIDRFWWEADFSLKNAEKSVKSGDVAYAAGCCFRCVACLAQTLFAINEQYWMNEKGAIAIADGFDSSPARLKERVQYAFKQLSGTPGAISAAIKTLYDLLEDSQQYIDV